jgi:hypothetical protein
LGAGFGLGLSAVCVSADAASFLISAFVNVEGAFSPLEAILAMDALVFSLLAMVDLLERQH